ncbi:metalloendoproteinase 1-MMP-like [Curcuma longa]|uniref:metalloendoproteinase 1-MMP-like n=1 Tax=Curcuma longa TaxID=136217 RepID=UPI003D9F490C
MPMPMHSFPSLFLLLLLLLLSFSSSLSPRPIPENDDQHREVLFRATQYSNHTWRSFHRLLDLERGSHVNGLIGLKKYFVRFGYLISSNSTDSVLSDAFDARLEMAVLRYQASLGLPVTGKLDAATLSEIMAPRCGVPDLNLNRSRAAKPVQRFTFFTGKPRWAGRKPLILTYAISPEHTINYVATSDVAATIRRAFDHWARVIPVRFEEATHYESADVKLGFYGGDHGDGEPFDGVLGILGHAFSPESGRLHLDAAEQWAVDLGKESSEVAVDLESVATHEIGHVLGLGHSTVKEAVMYPSLSPRTKKVELKVDDIEGVQALYGSNPNFRLTQTVQSETSSAMALRDAIVWRSIRTIGILLIKITMINILA